MTFSDCKGRCLWVWKEHLMKRFPQCPSPPGPPPQQAGSRLFSVLRAYWWQMSYQKCFFPFGGRIREQRGLLNLHVWRWEGIRSSCQTIAFFRLPSSTVGRISFENQISTTTTHPAGNLLSIFNFNSPESLLARIGGTVKSQTAYVGRNKGQYFIYLFSLHNNIDRHT